MARPIEPTPTLKGKDAKRFYESIDKAQHDPKKERQIEEARRVYRAVKPHWRTTPSDFSQR